MKVELEKAYVEKALDAFYNVANNAVSHVGRANYAERQTEAKEWVYEAHRKCLDTITKLVVKATGQQKPAVPKPPKPFTLYFVLNGLQDGEDGVLAKKTGVGDTQSDGWYWLGEHDEDGRGPFLSKEKATQDAVNTLKKHVLGHDFFPMTEFDWQGFMGAEEGTYICYIESGNKEIVTALLLSPDGCVHEHITRDSSPLLDKAHVWKKDVII